MRTILCIPGAWSDRPAFLASCARAGLAAAGAFIVDGLRGVHLEFELRERDERLRDAFRLASGGEIEGDELAAIGEHGSVLYLIGETGDLDQLRGLLSIATRLLPHGALGIKVESAGVAAPITRWLELSVRFDPFTLIRCFVVVATGEGDAYSCGMHNLGFSDATLSGGSGVTAEEAKLILDRFNLYQLVERPTLRDGQTFATAPNAPTFVLHHTPCTEWPKDDPFHNPFGMWRLVRLPG